MRLAHIFAVTIVGGFRTTSSAALLNCVEWVEGKAGEKSAAEKAEVRFIDMTGGASSSGN